jgi:hypothetical protein
MGVVRRRWYHLRHPDERKRMSTHWGLAHLPMAAATTPAASPSTDTLSHTWSRAVCVPVVQYRPHATATAAAAATVTAPAQRKTLRRPHDDMLLPPADDLGAAVGEAEGNLRWSHRWRFQEHKMSARFSMGRLPQAVDAFVWAECHLDAGELVHNNCARHKSPPDHATSSPQVWTQEDQAIDVKTFHQVHGGSSQHSPHHTCPRPVCLAVVISLEETVNVAQTHTRGQHSHPNPAHQHQNAAKHAQVVCQRSHVLVANVRGRGLAWLRSHVPMLRLSTRGRGLAWLRSHVLVANVEAFDS